MPPSRASLLDEYTGSLGNPQPRPSPIHIVVASPEVIPFAKRGGRRRDRPGELQAAEGLSGSGQIGNGQNHVSLLAPGSDGPVGIFDVDIGVAQA